MIISESELRKVLRCIREYDQIEECAKIGCLKQEIEKLVVDSVTLDEIISVVHGWNRDARGYPDMAMKKIAKIIDERGD